MNKWIRYFIFFLCITSNYVLANTTADKLKIISLTPSLTDMVIELGAGDLLVGASTFDKQRLPILSKLDAIGNFGNYSLEKIISLKPDIILLLPSAITPIQEKQLESLGIKIIKQDPKTLDALTKDFVKLGKQIGKEQEALTLANKIQQQLTTITNKYYRDKPLTVFYQLWNKPLYTIGKQQIINDALHICGARNIFDDINLTAAPVNIETVLLRNPDIIVASEQPALDDWKQWKSLNAVKNNKLILFQDDRIARPSMAMIEGVKNLCEQLNNKTNSPFPKP